MADWFEGAGDSPVAGEDFVPGEDYYTDIFKPEIQEHEQKVDEIKTKGLLGSENMGKLTLALSVYNTISDFRDKKINRDVMKQGGTTRMAEYIDKEAYDKLDADTKKEWKVNDKGQYYKGSWEFKKPRGIIDRAQQFFGYDMLDTDLSTAQKEKKTLVEKMTDDKGIFQGGKDKRILGRVLDSLKTSEPDPDPVVPFSIPSNKTTKINPNNNQVVGMNTHQPLVYNQNQPSVLGNKNSNMNAKNAIAPKPDPVPTTTTTTDPEPNKTTINKGNEYELKNYVSKKLTTEDADYLTSIGLKPDGSDLTYEGLADLPSYRIDIESIPIGEIDLGNMKNAQKVKLRKQFGLKTKKEDELRNAIVGYQKSLYDNNPKQYPDFEYTKAAGGKKSKPIEPEPKEPYVAPKYKTWYGELPVEKLYIQDVRGIIEERIGRKEMRKLFGNYGKIEDMKKWLLEDDKKRAGY